MEICHKVKLSKDRQFNGQLQKAEDMLYQQLDHVQHDDRITTTRVQDKDPDSVANLS